MLSDNVHTGFHVVFSNQLPHEQIGRLMEINGLVLTEKYKRDLEEVINMPRDYVYKNGVLIPNH